MLVNVKLHRIDYAQVGKTSRGCMRVIKGDKELAAEKPKKGQKKSKYKVVVGGANGILLCIERRGDETKVVFKTSTGPPIAFVRLGGALNTIQDKVFISTGPTVKGYSKKGKQFLSFESNMAGSITSMFIYGVDMFLTGRNTLYHFHDCVEKNTYICTDHITDVIVLPVVEGGWIGRGLTPVISCEDKTLKIIQDNRLVYEILLGDIPNVLHLFMNDGGLKHQQVLYGTRNGRMGLVDLNERSGSILWEIATTSSAAITALYCHGISANTRPDILVGKDDGLVEIFAVDENDKTLFRQSYNCDESVTSLEAVCIDQDRENYDEIIVCTYTGWVFGLSTESLTNKGLSNTDAAPQLQVKVQQMQTELEELEHRVKEERERYHETTQMGRDDFGRLDSIPTFEVNDRFVLNKELACYTLSLELVVPIEYVFLQSDVNVELMDVERNSAVISMTPPDPETESQLLAVYRCQADVKRMEMRIRSIEGQFGTLRAYIVPRLQLGTCQVRSYSIKPLALHERAHSFVESRPQNTLIFSGQFSISEAHSWLVMCVSEVPERCPDEDNVVYNFHSTFNGGTQLQAEYSRGRAAYRSDNLSTIVILRDVISKVVTNKQLKVQITCDFNDDSVEHALKLIHPKIEYQSQLSKRLELANGLKELQAAFGNVTYLNDELKGILRDHDQLYDEADEKAVYFDRIVGIIIDLYIDRFKVRGQSVGDRANKLLQLLHEDYSLENVLQFFRESIRS